MEQLLIFTLFSCLAPQPSFHNSSPSGSSLSPSSTSLLFLHFLLLFKTLPPLAASPPHIFPPRLHLLSLLSNLPHLLYFSWLPSFFWPQNYFPSCTSPSLFLCRHFPSCIGDSVSRRSRRSMRSRDRLNFITSHRSSSRSSRTRKHPVAGPGRAVWSGGEVVRRGGGVAGGERRTGGDPIGS